MVIHNGNYRQFMVPKKMQFPDTPSFNVLDEEIYSLYRNRILNIVLNRFIWEKLPDDIPSWFIEDTLLYQGIGVFYHEDFVDKYCFSPVVLEGGMDIYGQLVQRHIMAPNGYNTYRFKNDSVIIYDTYNNFPTYQNISLYAKLLTRMTIIYLKNLDMQRKSFAVIGTQDTELSVKNLVKEITEGIEYISMKNNFDVNSIKPLNFNVPYIGAELYTQIKSIWVECLNSYGIEGYTTNKKEREVTGETEGSLGYVEIARNSFLNARTQALQEVKAMFPAFKDTTVRFNSLLDTKLNLPFLENAGITFPEIYEDMSTNKYFHSSRLDNNGGSDNE